MFFTFENRQRSLDTHTVYCESIDNGDVLHFCVFEGSGYEILLYSEHNRFLQFIQILVSLYINLVFLTPRSKIKMFS